MQPGSATCRPALWHVILAGTPHPAGGMHCVQVHRRQARLLRRRLDAIGFVLDPLLARSGNIATCLPALQRLHGVLQDAHALLIDFSGGACGLLTPASLASGQCWT